MSHTYEFPRPSLTVDCIVFGFDGGALQLLLIERGIEPFKGAWALPGGFVQMDETLNEAARRELAEEADLKSVFLEQLFTFGEVDRDPRGRVVSVAYSALVRPDQHPASGGTDAADAQWFSLSDLPDLAFDHQQMVDMALERLRGKIRYQPVGFELLPESFTLSQLQALYESILDRPIDKRNFRKKATAYDFILGTDNFETGPHRPARLYRFDQKRYQELSATGINFEL